MKISTVFIVYNEEDRLENALISCRDLSDEIIIVDSYSSDNTCKIAEKYNCKILQREFTNYGDQKNFAVNSASNDWVLNMDADERLSEELRSEIKEIISDSSEPDAAGFFMKRRTSYLGRWIRHSAWYPDKKLRFFNRKKGEWKGEIHETVHVKGKTLSLKGDLLHHTYRDLTDHIHRINKYTEMQAEIFAKSDKKLLLLRGLLLPGVTFLRFYVFKLGFLDMLPGLIIALVSSWGTAMKYFKAYIKRQKHESLDQI